MALERPQGAIRFMFWIKMQHYSCDFAPISAIQIRIEPAQILDEVFLVVSGQYGIGGRGISDIGIKRCRLHGRSRNRLSSINCALAPWHIDDREASCLPTCAMLNRAAIQQRSRPYRL